MRSVSERGVEGSRVVDYGISPSTSSLLPQAMPSVPTPLSSLDGRGRRDDDAREEEAVRRAAGAAPWLAAPANKPPDDAAAGWAPRARSAMSGNRAGSPNQASGQCLTRQEPSTREPMIPARSKLCTRGHCSTRRTCRRKENGGRCLDSYDSHCHCHCHLGTAGVVMQLGGDKPPILTLGHLLETDHMIVAGTQ